MIRLQKFLADAGIASRRRAEELILAGRVKVNGRVIRELGVKVSATDEISYNGRKIKPEPEKICIMLNKPAGYLSTVRQGREQGKTVLDLVKSPYRIYPIGRLDRDSSGLLLLTNDGELALELMHPRFQKQKEYLVEVDQPLTPEFLANMRRGVKLGHELTLPAEVKPITANQFKIILRQGLNRQIRRMCQTLNYRVVSLTRLRINGLKLGRLPSGQYQVLTEPQIRLLKQK